MTTASHLIASFAALSLLVGSFSIACSKENSSDDLLTKASPTATLGSSPTSTIGKPANTLEQALSLARGHLTASPPYVVHEIESVVYVETTAGQARKVFDADGTMPSDRWLVDAPDDAPAWVVMASGIFQAKAMTGSLTPGPSFTSVWVVIPNGERGLQSGPGFQQYDLSPLGKVINVPVPLPPFPTPITVDGQ